MEWATSPPDRGTRQRFCVPSSSAMKKMEAPSGEKRGSVALRSKDWVRTRAGPPETGETATWWVAYSNRWGSSWVVYVISLPSGDQEGVSSSPGFVVTCVSWAPLSVLLAATTQMSVL